LAKLNWFLQELILPLPEAQRRLPSSVREHWPRGRPGARRYAGEPVPKSSLLLVGMSSSVSKSKPD